MVTQSQIPKHHLNPINTHWHNRSLSSLSATSDAATFHSAHAHLSNMELRQLSLTQRHHPSVLTSLPLSGTTQALPSPQLTAIKMDRQDSGYAESQSHSTPQSPTSTSHSRRTSASSSVKRRNSPSSSQNMSSRPKKRTAHSSSSSNTTRPPTKRTTTSQGRISNSGSRPSLSSRHTTPFAHQQQQQPYQFFQFPSLADPSSPPPTSRTSNISPLNTLNSNSPSNPHLTTVSPPPPPPPTTIQYWTSDSTRRLEYAAIDAASKGIRGFFIKLLPDCILPASSRRTKFHCEDDEGGSDAGSVRRYRLVLPEEGEKEMKGRGVERGTGSGRRGLLRRWTSFGRRGGRMD
ncbi:hypothetical protein ONS95_011844 [Cadophora gregata]|uniref:uncharacterized protein n=1 Tax=Cadophora gregata TaxID=51156 RepID=UPI0026DC2C7D|nr:uncharacterized protein ONS95_011844 [Cadophora gregata]KAK0117504.1 hypothetical protein ONS95_011844 [Cadophora gregata]